MRRMHYLRVCAGYHKFPKNSTAKALEVVVKFYFGINHLTRVDCFCGLSKLRDFKMLFGVIFKMFTDQRVLTSHAEMAR